MFTVCKGTTTTRIGMGNIVLIHNNSTDITGDGFRDELFAPILESYRKAKQSNINSSNHSPPLRYQHDYHYPPASDFSTTFMNNVQQKL